MIFQYIYIFELSAYNFPIGGRGLGHVLPSASQDPIVTHVAYTAAEQMQDIDSDEGHNCIY